MVVLTEQIEIPASYEKLEAWTANFEEEFVKWSPYHIECNLYNGNYHAGSKVRFREIVMGLDYDVTGTIDRSVVKIQTYQALDTIKIAPSNRTAQEIPDEICVL